MPLNWKSAVARHIDSLRGRGVGRLTENIVSLSVLQATHYLLPLVALPYLVRILGVEKFGLVAFAQAFIQFFVIATDFGFNLSATREIASCKNDPDKVSRIFCSAMIVKMTLLVLGFGVLAVLVLLFERFRSDAQLYFLTYGIVVGSVLFPVWFFQGMEQMKYSTVLNIVAKIIFVALIFCVVRQENDYIYVPVLNSLGSITAGLLSLWLVVVRFRIPLRLPGLSAIIEQVRISFQFFLSRVSVSLYTNFNTFILGLLTDNQTVGYYAAAEKLFIAMRTAFAPLVQSLYPFMSARRDTALFKKIFYSALTLAVVAAVVAAVLSGQIAQLVFGPGYGPSADVFRLFSLIVPVVAASIMLGYPFLAALGREKYANFSVAIGSLCHLILIGLIVPVISMHLVVGVTMLTEIIILAIRVRGVRKHHLWSAV